MAYKTVRNQNYDSYTTIWSGNCQRFEEEATLTIYLSGKQERKYDLQPTFTPRLKECSLLKAKDTKNTACTLSCPIFEAYKNSHSY